MRRAVQCAAAMLVAPLIAGPILADVGPPAHMQITEREPGLYSVQWRVPNVLPPRAVPEPVLPETCQPEGERSVETLPGAWLFKREWRCETGLAGQIIDMRYPFPDLALTTVVKVDLLSGDRFAHVLSPGEGPWQLPEGTAAPDVLGDARRAVVAGAAHVAGSWVHLVFLITLCLLGGYREVIRLVSVFTLGQVAGVLAGSLAAGIGAVPAEMCFGVCVAVVARQALSPPEKRVSLVAAVAAAGLVHGLGTEAILAAGSGDAGARLSGQILAVLGMDAVHLVAGAGLAALWALVAPRDALPRARRVMAYGAGAAGVALALALAVGGGGSDRGGRESSVMAPEGTPASSTAGVAGSRRVAPSSPDMPLESFITVEPFEVRHEAMLRLAGLADLLDLDPASSLGVDAQARLKERLSALVTDNTTIVIDGENPEAFVRRIDFMTLGPTGVLPRPSPVPEAVSEAVVGVVVAYPTEGMPGEVSFAWESFPAGEVAATVIDPETVASKTLSEDEPFLIWENNLVQDPIPTVAAVLVEPFRLPLPWLSVPLLAAAAVLVSAGLKGRRPGASFAAARVVLALAILVGPVVQTAVALPGSAGRTPSERQARRILAGLLPNIYRAMELRDEPTIYDRLAISVTGDALTDVYLGQRRALQIEERGGAQARVEAVEVQEAADIVSEETGFGVRSAWTVGGMVTHFGHRHFRQNRYNARVVIVPLEGTWKIQSIEVLEQERLR